MAKGKRLTVQQVGSALKYQEASHDSPILPADEIAKLSTKLPEDLTAEVVRFFMSATQEESAHRRAQEQGENEHRRAQEAEQQTAHIKAAERNDKRKHIFSMWFVFLIFVVLVAAILSIIFKVTDWRIYSALGSIIVALSVAARVARSPGKPQ